MILDIMQIGEAVLRKKCNSVNVVDGELRQLVGDMIETMIDAEGVGLAAPQVGVELQLAVVDTSHDPECVSFFKVNGADADMQDYMPLVFINPKLEFSGNHETEFEGCLSIQDVRAKVKRRGIVKATLPQLDGSVLVIETDGLCSRAIQHEVDHLNGILFIDRITSSTKSRLKKKLKSLAETRWQYNDQKFNKSSK